MIWSMMNQNENLDHLIGGSLFCFIDDNINRDESRTLSENWWKLIIQIFECDDVFGWTNRVEMYFDMEGNNDNEKL